MSIPAASNVEKPSLPVWQGCLSAIVVAAAAFACGVLGVRRALAADGVAPDDSDAGNRFGAAVLGLSGVTLTVGISLTCWVLAVVAVRRHRALVAASIGIIPAVLAIALIPWWWHG